MMDIIGGVVPIIDIAERIRKLIDDCQKAPERLRLLQQDVASLQLVLEQLGRVDQSGATVGTSFQTHIVETEALLEKIHSEVSKITKAEDYVFARPMRSIRMQRAMVDLSKWSVELQNKKASLALAVNAHSLTLLTTVETGLNPAKTDARPKMTNKDERRAPVMTLDNFLDALHAPNYVEDQLRIKQAPEGTAGWIYDCPQYKEWLDSPNQVASLHLVGKMGSGKSVLMKSVAQVLQRKGSENMTGIIYCFCTCVNRVETGLSILKGLIAQLVNNYPDLFEQSIGNMEMLRPISSQNSPSWSFEALGNILVTLFQHVSFTHLYCVVDALDECDRDGVMDFLQFTQGLQKVISKDNAKIRFLFSSRDYPHIIASLDAREACPRIFIQPQVVASDIRLAMQDDFKSLKKVLELDDEEGERIQQALVEKSDGMFLWVSLAIKEIMSSNSVFTGEDLDTLIHSLPIGLKGLYEKAWAKALELLPPKHISLARRVLLWLLLAQRPLTITELTTAMAVEPGNKHVPSPQKLLRSLSRFILTYLNPFVEVQELDPNGSAEIPPEDPGDPAKDLATRGFAPPGLKARLIHQSAQEYLLGICKEGSGAPDLKIDLKNGHEEIARICLSYLRCEELQLGWLDVENRDRFGLQVITNETRKVVRQRLQEYPLLHYAANHWGHHVRMCQYSDSTERPNLEKEADDIFQYTLDFLNDYRLGDGCARQARQVTTYGDLDSVYGPVPPLSAVVIAGVSSLVRRLLDDPKTDPFAPDYGGDLPIHCATTVDALTDYPQERCQIVRMILETGADINCIGTAGDTPLHCACRMPLPDVVRLLLEKGANPSILNDEGFTPLNQSETLKSCPVVEALLEAGADSTTPDPWGYTPIMNATRYGYLDTVRLLIKFGADPAPTRLDSCSTIQLAAEKGHLGVIDALLDAGVDINLATKNGDWTALHYAAGGGMYDAVQKLLSRGANPKVTSADGYWPLHSAARSGSTKVLELLMPHHPNSDLQANNNTTPLHTAVESNHPGCVSLLLAHGADIEAKRNMHPSQPLHIAAFWGYLDCVKVLLDHGAIVNGADDEYAETPLLHASREGDLEIVELLIQRGAQVDQVDTTKNHGALHHAAKEGHEEVVECLLRHGASVNLPGYKGLTPFQCSAAHGGKVETSKILLRWGAQVDIGPHSFPLFGVACYKGHTDVVRWMLDNAIGTVTSIDTMIWDCEKCDGHPHIVEMLIDHGIGPNEPGLDGTAPIFACIEHNRHDILEVLVKRGAEVNIFNNEGNVPLTAAAMVGRVDMIGFLLKHGADLSMSQVDLVTSAAETAIDVDLREQFAEMGLVDVAREGYYERLTRVGAVTKGENLEI